MLAAIAVITLFARLMTVPVQPNVVLVVGCTLRKDQLSPYGAPEVVTPFLSQMARKGVSFDDAWAAAPWTRMASTALFAGTHARAVGMVEPGPSSNRRRLSDQVNTLAERFQAAGWDTWGVTANPNLNAVFGFQQGYDRWLESSALWRGESGAKVPGTRVVQTTLDGLTQRISAKPLFVSLVLVDAHEPVHAHPEERAELGPDAVPAAVVDYRAGARRFDTAVSELWQGLEGLGFTAENTVFSVVSDHGQGLSWPPHHGVGHGALLFSSSVAMPWLLWGPGVHARRIGGIASQIDVAPTLLGLAGIGAGDLPGRDWAELLRSHASRTDLDVAWVDTDFQQADRSASYTELVNCHEDFDRSPEKENRRILPQQMCFARADVDQENPGMNDLLLGRLREWRAEQEAAYRAFPDVGDGIPSRAERLMLMELGYEDY